MLIVEDDPGIRRVITSHFRRHGFQVEYAVAAEEVASDEPYDVVVTDIHLPGASGVELARRMHSVHPDQQFIFMTGDADARVAREALRHGAAAYLLKPFELFELDAAVNSAVRYHHAPALPPLGRSIVTANAPRPMVPHIHLTTEAPVVFAPAQRWHTRRTNHLRVATAIAAMVALAWGVGVAIAPPKVPPSPAPAAVSTTGSQPIVVPVVVEKSVYLR